MKLSEIYLTHQDRIEPSNIETFKDGLTISKAEVIGKKRKGILLSFKETPLQHKCNRVDAFSLADHIQTDETENFVGHKVYFYSEEDSNIVRLALKEKTDHKEDKKKK